MEKRTGSNFQLNPFGGYTPPKINIEPEKNVSKGHLEIKSGKKPFEANLHDLGGWPPPPAVGSPGLPNGLRPLRPRRARQRPSRPRRHGRRATAAGAPRAAAAAGTAGELGKAGFFPSKVEVCDSGYQQTDMTIMA